MTILLAPGKWRGKRARRKYVKAMIVAIDKAAHDCFGRVSSRTCGLRAIRRFERVNNRSFDPFDIYHQSLITGCGPWEALFRHVDLFHAKRKEPTP